MGCWNETCALTRLPIQFGAPVVALNMVHGPLYKSSQGSGNTALLFGLPLEGLYDDYGGVEHLTNPQLTALHDQAFINAGYYKKWDAKSSYGSGESRWVVAHADTLWSLTDAIKPVFYPQVGMRMSEVNAHDESSRAKSLEAYHKAEAALKELGTRMGAATFSENVTTGHDEMFSIFEDVFGKDYAWAAWSAIQNKGIFASFDQILMHQSAYQAVVQEFGQRKVGYYNEKQRYALRDFLAMQLDRWLAEFPAEYKKLERLFGDDDDNPAPFEKRKRVLRYASNRNYSYLAPLTSMWMAPEVPLVGHFWGGATPEEILEVVSKDTLVDYFVFQWARSYLRLDLTKSASGSQNQEVVLPANMFKATLKVLRDQKLVKKDFDGSLFR